MKKWPGRLAAALLAVILVLTIPCAAGAANDSTLSAVSVVVLETKGNVEITNQAGNTIPVFDNMQLHSGYTVTTDLKSYAWMSLDDTKEAGLDSVSNMAVQKKGKQLVLMLDEGSMFFDVSQKLDSEETMNIRTSTMVMGIKGTFGIVKAVNNMETDIVLLDGSTEIIGVNTISGKTMRASLSAGQTAAVQLHEDGSLDIFVGTVQADSIPGFVLAYLSDHADTAKRIEDGGTVPELETLMGEADERLEEEEKDKEEKLNESDSAHEKEMQEADSSADPIDPYFKQPGTVSTKCTHEWIFSHVWAESHTMTCSLCGETFTDAHSFDGCTSAGGAGHTVTCSICGYTATQSHNFVYQPQGVGMHVQICSSCGYTDGTTGSCRENLVPGYDSSNHFDQCSVCGAKLHVEAHTWNGCTSVDSTYHQYTCDCGYSYLEEHNVNETGMCVDCGEVP